MKEGTSVDRAPVDAVVIQCPLCGREWPHGCEQWVAVTKRGKCIVCLVSAKESWESDPYEFQSLPSYTAKHGETLLIDVAAAKRWAKGSKPKD